MKLFGTIHKKQGLIKKKKKEIGIEYVWGFLYPITNDFYFSFVIELYLLSLHYQQKIM